MRSLIWFRNDLRISDNTALASACARADRGVVAVFLVASRQWARHDWGSPKIDFILRNVAALSQALMKLNIPLHVIECEDFRDAPQAIAKIAKEQQCDAVFFNREYEVNELARDAAATVLLTKEGFLVAAFDDQTVLPPDELRTGAGQFYRVFTPFKNAWIDAVTRRLPVKVWEVPKSARKDLKHKEALSATLPRPLPKREGSPGQAIAKLWPAGEAEAQRRLQSFIAKSVVRYKEDRDFPAINGTSSLSPYLSAGVISPRQCLVAAMAANEGRIDSGERGITTWISELIWREFYRHVLVGFPRVCKRQPFRLETQRITWRDDDAGFAAWCEGQTGVPLVDAAMRQLSATGWLHNRLRMVSAMFLTKDLFIDWRRGERFFMQKLVDADLAQNNGGWQWSASTGTDAAPYFRIFNPISQSRKFDPRGTFIRQYCPELRELDDEMIHDPSELPPLLRGQLDYPQPVVDHREARARVMAAFGAVK